MPEQKKKGCMRNVLKIGVLIALVATLAVACTYLNRQFGLKPDNMIEESVEAVLEHHTGVDIDLSPSSKENGC